MTRIIQFAHLWLTLTLALAVTAPLPVRVQAESEQPSSQSLPTNWGVYNPGDVGDPGRREGGGTRSPCIRNSANYKLTALIPNSTFGATTAENPTFLVFVPAIEPGRNPVMEFVLKTEDRREIYKTKFKVTGSPGIVSFSLPTSNNLHLKMEKDYRWTFTLVCNPEDDESGDLSGNRLVEGLIRRVPAKPELAQRLEQARSQRDRVIAYSGAGIWYDALTTLAELRRNNPSNPALARDWRNLLQSEGLENIAKEPLLQPVAASNLENLPVSSDR